MSSPPRDLNFSAAANLNDDVRPSAYVITSDNNITDDMYESDMFNDVLDDFRASLYTYRDPSTIVLLCFYVPIFLLALFGNVLVFLIIVGNKNMRSVTNYFLLNLAIADILVTIVCIPLTVGETVYKAWVYGDFLCKATGYLQGVCVSASVLTIMALSIDRYIAIRHPVKSRRLSTKKHVKIAIVLIWVISCGIMVPLTVVRSLSSQTIIGKEHLNFCHENWPSAKSRHLFDTFLFVFIYVIPGVIVTSSYSATGCHLLSSEDLLQRQDSDAYQNSKIMAGRRRVARMLLILAILFAVSWMPYYAVNLYLNFSSERDTRNSLMTLSFSLMLGHSHSAQNPILYCLTNNSFKRGMIGLLKCQNTHLSDFTRASTRSDPQYTRRYQSEQKKGGSGMSSRRDGCLATANPMTTGHESAANGGRSHTMPSYLPSALSSTLPSSASSDGEGSAREEVPLMEVNHRVNRSQPTFQKHQNIYPFHGCRVEVSPCTPSVTKTLVCSEGNVSLPKPPISVETHSDRLQTLSSNKQYFVNPRTLSAMGVSRNGTAIIRNTSFPNMRTDLNDNCFGNSNSVFSERKGKWLA